MHTTELTVSGNMVRIHHNSDLSGTMILHYLQGDEQGQCEIPAWALHQAYHMLMARKSTHDDEKFMEGD